MNRFFKLIVLLLLAGSCVNAKVKVDNPEKFESKELLVSGEVQESLKLGVAELKKLDAKTLVLDPKACMTGQSKRAEESYRGILLKDLLNKAGILAKAHNDVKRIVVIARATDGYTVVFSWGELFLSKVGEGVMVAFEKDDKPLKTEEGKIALVSINDSQNSRHIRWLSSIEVHKL
ncbi:MAG: molybdopterin-dependent oxidoreductase [Bdellovibrio sp.]|nr:molybdopterin-dependent oxidoreductase [Bdellovibrio sp.]